MRLILAIVFLFSSSFLYSQSFEVGSFFSDSSKNGKIEGNVYDTEVNNGPLLFATIAVKNSTIATTTNVGGSFILNVKPGTYTLIFSFIGYKTTEVENIVVTSNNTSLQNQTLMALKMNAVVSLVSSN